MLKNWAGLIIFNAQDTKKIERLRRSSGTHIAYKK